MNEHLQLLATILQLSHKGGDSDEEDFQLLLAAP